MAIVEGQKIEVRWGSRNKEWFINKGYTFTKMFDYFYVDAKHLMENNKSEIKIYCDECDEVDTLRNDKYHLKIEREERIYCKECSYKLRVDKRMDKFHNKFSHENKIDIFNEVINKKRERFPDSFYSGLTTDEYIEMTKIFISKLISDKIIKSEEDIPMKLRQKHFRNYGLWSFQDNIGIYNLISLAYPNRWNAWDFHVTTNKYWKNEDNCREAIDWLFGKLLEEGKLKEFDEMPRKLTQSLLIEYRVGGMLNYYEKGIPEIMMKLYPNTFNKWDFNVSKGYYQNEENRKEIMTWLVEQLFNDGIINNLDDIPKIATRATFEKYSLRSFLAHCFQLSPFRAFDFLYPNKWKKWEYKYSPNNLWNDPQNVREAIIWVVDKCKSEGLIKNVTDLNSKNLSEIFTQFNISGLFIKYDIPFMISMIYGSEFNYMDNKIFSDIDGTKMDSLEELQVHDWLVSNFSNVKHLTNKKGNKWYNPVHDENYIPDWIINKNVIVEYFGLYSPENTHKSDVIKSYVDKTHRKIEYFNSCKDFIFIDLYPHDLDNNMQGVISKLRRLDNKELSIA